jgi:hypothetical protein
VVIACPPLLTFLSMYSSLCTKINIGYPLAIVKIVLYISTVKFDGRNYGHYTRGHDPSNLTPTARDHHDPGVDAPDWSLAAAMLEPVAWTGRRGEGNA